jgi:hypothetical protein
MTLFSFVLLSQVFSYCPGTIFYDQPNGKVVNIEGTPNSSISDIHYLDRDPHRVPGWVEIVLRDGRYKLSDRTYWIKGHDICGKFIGR